MKTVFENYLHVQDVSRWTCLISDDLSCSWEQRHDRQHCFCFLPELLLSIERYSQFNTSIYYKRDACNFHITNFLFLSSDFFQVIGCHRTLRPHYSGTMPIMWKLAGGFHTWSFKNLVNWYFLEILKTMYIYKIAKNSTEIPLILFL